MASSLNENDSADSAFTSQASRRRLLTALGASGLAATGALATLAGGGRAQEGTSTPGSEASVPPGLPPFLYHLEQSEPQLFERGTIRTATVENIPRLKDISLYSETIDPGSLREMHWHPNANELSYVLGGEGMIGLVTAKGESITFPVSVGSASFVPIGYPHYIVNTGADPLRLVLAFSHEKPEFIDFSVALPPIPTSLVAETFGVEPAAIPLLPQRGDRAIVPLDGEVPRAEMTDAAKAFTVNSRDIAPTEYVGGTTRPVITDTLPSLEGLSVFPLTADPYGLREPHWHPNAAELNYCVSGQAQIEMVAPSGGIQTFVVGPGDVCYLPMNWFHYIANVTDETLEFLVFFTNPTPSHVDLSQLPAAIPAAVLAASFGIDPEIIERLPRRGDVFIASDEIVAEATPAP